MKPAEDNLKLKRIITAVVILIAVSISILIVTNLIIINDSQASIVQSINAAPSAPVAIILGSYVRKGNIAPPIMEDRLDTGIELYRIGKVKKLLLTGDSRRLNYDEVDTMRKYVLTKGIPPQDVFLDHESFCTYDSIYRARDVFKVKNAIIVTQKFHLARAVYTARLLGINAVGIPSDRRSYHFEEVINEARESLARTKAFIELNLTHPLPKFLGPQIPITGDGRITNN